MAANRFVRVQAEAPGFGSPSLFAGLRPASSCRRWGLEGFGSCESPLCHPLPRWHYASREEEGNGLRWRRAAVVRDGGWFGGERGRRRLSPLNFTSVSSWNLSIWQNCAASDKPARSRTLPPAPPCSLFLSPLHPSPHHPLLSPFFSSSLSALEANALARLQASRCQIGGPYLRWQRLKQWLGKERGEDERRRAKSRKGKRESWREKGKKEGALGFASGRMRSSNIDLALFFSSLFCALLSLAPPSVCACV